METDKDILINVSQIIIGKILHDPSILQLVVGDGRLPDAWLIPEPYASVYDSLVKEEERSITPESIAHLSNFSATDLNILKEAGRKVTDEEFTNAVEIVLDRGKRIMGGQIIGEFERGLSSELPAERVITNAIHNLEGLATYGTMNSEFEFIDQLDGYQNKLRGAAPRAGADVGIRALNQWTFGFPRQEITLSPAPYKQRKTTLWQNVALGALSRGTPVSWVMSEGSLPVWIAGMQAKIATHLLRKAGKKTAPIWPMALLQSRNWNKDRHVVEALEVAYSMMRRMPITALDVRSGVRNPDRIFSIWQRAKLDNQLTVGIIDFVQQVAWPGRTLYERMENAANMLVEWAQKLDMHIIVLSQMNEEGVKGDRTSYSPNAKGGGDLPAAASFTIETRYNQTDNPGEIIAEMKLNRFGPSDSVIRFHIEPVSGLITGVADGSNCEVVAPTMAENYQLSLAIE